MLVANAWQLVVDIDGEDIVGILEIKIRLAILFVQAMVGAWQGIGMMTPIAL
jgi:hypothetical protein